MRVPPSQSVTRAAAAARDASTSRPPSSSVSRVSRVLKQKTSTSRVSTRAVYAKCSSARECPAMEPDTSRTRTSRRGRRRRRRQQRRSSSPSVCTADLMVRRRSGTGPLRAGRVWRVRRCGTVTTMLPIRSRIARSSSSVASVNRRPRNASTVEAIAPATSSCSRSA